MSNNRYVILNCPTLMGNKLCYSKTTKQCADCTDCKLKQIVELCRNIDCPCEYQGVDCWECSRIGAKTFADKILKLLDIQEVE